MFLSDAKFQKPSGVIEHLCLMLSRAVSLLSDNQPSLLQNLLPVRHPRLGYRTAFFELFCTQPLDLKTVFFLSTQYFCTQYSPFTLVAEILPHPPPQRPSSRKLRSFAAKDGSFSSFFRGCQVVHCPMQRSIQVSIQQNPPSPQQPATFTALTAFPLNCRRRTPTATAVTPVCRTYLSLVFAFTQSSVLFLLSLSTSYFAL